MDQLGISVASRSGLGAAEVAALAAQAERAGFSAFLIAERAADAFALCHAALAATSRITVGTAVANAGLRHPALTAMTAATLDESSGGRFLLGLGTANRGLNQGALGLPPAAPLAMMRDYVEVVRRTLRGGEVRFDGEVFRLAGFRPDRPAPRASLPVVLGALLPKMLELAGEVADGVILNLVTTDRVVEAVEHVRRGAARTGRDRSGMLVACVLPCCPTGDERAGREAARDVVAGYAQHPAAGRLFADSGFAPDLAGVLSRLGRGDRAGARAMVSDAMIDALVLHGDPRGWRPRLDAYRAAGVDLPVLFPIPVGDDWEGAVGQVAEAFWSAGPRHHVERLKT
jgi:5,10-methylenetetrahydromethanopterin reductase